MTLLSLASKQIWPHVLAVAHLKPQCLILLHSEDVAESKGPAQRLKGFFDNVGLIPKGATHLELIPHDDFSGIERRLDELLATRNDDLGHCTFNFTGGNKLMATAAFRWSSKRGLKSFYLERSQQLTWFEPRDGELQTRTDKLDGHLTDHLDPVPLLRCQLDASEIEREGEKLVLNEAGQKLAEPELLHHLQDGNDPLPFLEIANPTAELPKEGDHLELVTAAVLLKLGVRQVQRSLRLKVRSAYPVGTRLPHAEIDLLFSWDGRLWLVDCKDRMPAEDLVTNLRCHLPRSLDANAETLLRRIQNELSIGQTKALKEDLFAVREAGGLLGNVVCVRKANLPDEVVQFARHNHIAVIFKRELVQGLRTLLFPTRQADEQELRSLAAHFYK